ncbi:MAG: S9 family peptidase, partial [Cytophagaceae bacterium]
MLHNRTAQQSCWILLVSWLAVSLTGYAQDAPTYQTPPKPLADLVTVPPTPNVSMSSKGDMMLILEQASAPSIAELAQPELKLAGLRLNPANTGPSRARYVTGLA